jgi:hypothetical protein
VPDEVPAKLLRDLARLLRGEELGERGPLGLAHVPAAQRWKLSAINKHVYKIKPGARKTPCVLLFYRGPDADVALFTTSRAHATNPRANILQYVKWYNLIRRMHDECAHSSGG